MAAASFGLGFSVLSKALTKAFQSREVNVMDSFSVRICLARSCAAPNKKALTVRPAVEAARTISYLISGEVRRSIRSFGSVVGMRCPLCTVNIRNHASTPIALEQHNRTFSVRMRVEAGCTPDVISTKQAIIRASA